MDARITELNAALEQCKASFEAVKAEYRATLQDGDVVGPNLVLAVERLCHISQHLQELGGRIDMFIAFRAIPLGSNGIGLIEEHDPADPVPFGPVEAAHDEPEEHDPADPVPLGPVEAAQDEPEEHDPGATEGTAENDTTAPGEIEDNTAASVVSVEDNWHQNALDPNNT